MSIILRSSEFFWRVVKLYILKKFRIHLNRKWMFQIFFSVPVAIAPWVLADNDIYSISLIEIP